jgi:hypothetical protein
MTSSGTTSRRKKRSKNTGAKSPEQVTKSFVVCPRCSFFLSGYKLIHPDFTEAVEQSTDGWLDLTWNHDTRRLIQKTYGSRIDKSTAHFEGICRDCQRVFICGETEEDGENTFFRIEIVPG